MGQAPFGVMECSGTREDGSLQDTVNVLPSPGLLTEDVEFYSWRRSPR